MKWLSHLIVSHRSICGWALFSLFVAGVLLLVPHQAVGATAQEVASEIRTEAIRPNQSPQGRPLPLVSHWTTGNHPLSEGWAPTHQIDLIEQGHFLLPWFEFPTTLDIASALIDFTTYYEAPIKRARDLGLPLVLVGTQWEQALYKDPYLSLPASQNPNVVTVSGDILPEVSPFGPVEPWTSLGHSLTDNPWFALLQEWYPDPPLVVFLSNNEARKLQWKDVETSARYVQTYGLGRDDDYKRKVVGDGWIARYRALQAGMRDGLVNTTWQSNAIFVGYDAFGPRHIGRWDGWAEYSLTTAGRVDPNPLMWDGGSSSYYTDNWNAMTDFKAYSPQIEFMNLVFQQRQAYQLNPAFWLEMSVWDGHEPDDPATDKWLYYESLGQTYTPQRYAGFTKFGMWLLRPRVVREYRDWLTPFADTGNYFMAMVDAVDEVHTNAILRDWWRTGELVPNRAHQHLYQSNFPQEYATEDRWFLLDADVNAPFPWDLSTEIPVFALALHKGEAPKRQWLVYAFAPLGDRQNVRITVPGYGNIKVNVEAKGSYYLIDESNGLVEKIK